MLTFQVTGPHPTAFEIFATEGPRTLVHEVHIPVVAEVAQVTSRKLKQNIRKKFRRYSPSDRNPDGSPKRWQTPTGALAQSIGVKKIPKGRLKSNTALALVGARTDFTASKEVKRRIRSFTTFGWNPLTRNSDPAPKELFVNQGPKGQRVRPARYFHLAMFGHGPGPKGLSFHAKANDAFTPTYNEMKQLMPGIIEQHYPKKFDTVIDAHKHRFFRRATVTWSKM